MSSTPSASGNVHIYGHDTKLKMCGGSGIQFEEGGFTRWHITSGALHPHGTTYNNLGNSSNRVGNAYIQTSVDLIDGAELRLGSDDDLKIYHSGSWNYIQSYQSKNLAIQVKDTENAIIAIPDGEVQLYHDNVKRLETTSTGAKVTGHLAFTSAGHGIDFGSSVHASGMSNELLDDYEEGSWTPVFATAGSGGSTVSNPSNTQATYVKVGRIVYLHLGVHGLTKNWAGSSTQVYIRGIPYRSYFQHSGHPVRHGYWGASDDDLNVYAQIHQYQTYISLQKGGGAQGRYEALYWSDMHWEGYGNLTMEITYETDQGV